LAPIKKEVLKFQNLAATQLLAEPIDLDTPSMSDLVPNPDNPGLPAMDAMDAMDAWMMMMMQIPFYVCVCARVPLPILTTTLVGLDASVVSNMSA
jgi:hypothetical protein